MFCVTSRYEDEEEQSSYSALDHIHRFSDMRKLEESELSDGDGDEEDGSFGSPSLTEAVKQPLFRKSKSQVNKISIQTYTYMQSMRMVTYTMYVNKTVICNPSPAPSGICHDAVPG